MNMFDSHDEIAFQVYIEGVEQDEEPVIDYEPEEDHDIDPIERE